MNYTGAKRFVLMLLLVSFVNAAHALSTRWSVDGITLKHVEGITAESTKNSLNLPAGTEKVGDIKVRNHNILLPPKVAENPTHEDRARGLDADDDGLFDDIEYYIAMQHSDNDQLRSSLYKMAYTAGRLIEYGRPEHGLDHLSIPLNLKEDYKFSQFCIFLAVDKDLRKAMAYSKDMFAEIASEIGRTQALLRLPINELVHAKYTEGSELTKKIRDTYLSRCLKAM